MGDNPLFYFCTLFYIWVLEVVTTVANSPYLYFIEFLFQVKSLIVKSILDLDYCAGTYFLLSRNLTAPSVGNSKKSVNLRAWSSDMYATSFNLRIFIWASLVPQKNTSLRTVLFWQILPFISYCLFCYAWWIFLFH